MTHETKDVPEPLAVRCPKCGASPGRECARSAKYAGEPHNARIREAERATHPRQQQAKKARLAAQRNADGRVINARTTNPENPND